MARVGNNSSISTTAAEVGWTAGNAHNFFITNTSDGPVRITVTPNNGLTFDERNIGRSGEGINHHRLHRDSFVLEGDSGIFLRLEALAVNSDPSVNNVTFAVSDLHTGIRNPENADNGAVFIALQADVQSAAL